LLIRLKRLHSWTTFITELFEEKTKS